MGYHLGIDVGEAFTGAGVVKDGRVEAVELTRHSTRIPTALYIPVDGDLVIGAAAVRRIATDPDRGAAAFVGRLGDPNPIVVGGSPYPAQALVARLLGRVVQDVVRAFGQAPASVTLTRPAGWSQWRSELLLGALRQADLPGDPVLATCEGALAVAAFRRHRGDLGEGERCAVYDFGAGGFCATVVEATGPGVAIMGEPAGLEHLGGFAIDEAVATHVTQLLGDQAPAAGSEDLRRLRAACVTAKEVLSDDVDVDIPLTGAGATATVRLTRAELDVVVGPAVEDTVRALRRAMRSASVDPAGLSSVLLVGGSSRLPQVAERLDAEFDGAVALVARPLGDAALGAAVLGSGLLGADPQGAGLPAASKDAPVPEGAGRPSTGTPVPVPAGPPLVAEIPETVVIGPPQPTSVPGLPPPGLPSPAVAATSGNGEGADAEDVGGAAGAARPGRSRRLVAGARRRPWIPAGVVAVIAAVAVVLALVPTWSGGSSGPAAEVYHYQPPAFYRAQEAAEKLPATKVVKTGGTPATTVTVAGSAEVAPITETAYTLFRETQKNVQVSVDAVDTEDGYAKLCKGDADISGASYPEDSPGPCAAQVTDFEVAHETLPIVVDPTNTWAGCLTLTQVQNIWRKDSTITNWNQVDPAFPNVPLSVDGFAQDSVQFAVFNAAVSASRFGGRSDYKTTGDGDAIAPAVSRTRGSIGYLDYPSYEKYAKQLHPVEINSGGGCVAPTLDNARAGRYLPLCKPLYIYVRLDALKKPAVAAFVRFYLNNSEEIANQAHYVPRDDGEIKESIEKIDTLTKGVGPVPSG